MLIGVKLGVPPRRGYGGKDPMNVDLDEVAKVFPYGKFLPLKLSLLEDCLSIPGGL